MTTFVSRLLMPAAASLLIATVAIGGELATVDLSPRFVLGREDKFTVELVSTREAKFVASTTTRPERYEQTLHVRRRILESNSDGAKIELTYENIGVNLVAGSKWVSYHTSWNNEPEPEEMVGKTVRPAHNKPFVVEVDALGRAVKVIGAPAAGPEGASMSLTGEEFIRRTLAPLYGLGKEPAAAEVGQTWTESRAGSPSQTGVVTTNRTYKLDSATTDRAEILITGSMTLEPSEKAREASTVLDSSSIAGRIVWDLAAGSVRSYEYDQSMKLFAETEGKKRVAMTSFKAKINAVDAFPPPPSPPKPVIPAPPQAPRAPAPTAKPDAARP